MIATF
jgi:hypothetical protein